MIKTERMTAIILTAGESRAVAIPISAVTNAPTGKIVDHQNRLGWILW